MPDSNPVFLITGASTGIGAATARHAAQAGYRLVLAARSKDKIDALAEELGGPERAIAVRADVAEWEDMEALAKAALDAFGRIDVAFANAGFGGGKGYEHDDPEDWRSMVLTNVYGAALTAKAVIPALKESKGHLLLTGSVAGRKPLAGSFYSATKFAVTCMGEGLREELDGTGVHVCLIEPGQVQTPFFDDPGEFERMEADDIAEAVMFVVTRPSRVDINEVLIRPTAQTR
jgi:NADP-dependent 3-hydroxy acid dehydrogenase YdfG